MSDVSPVAEFKKMEMFYIMFNLEVLVVVMNIGI
jgi:hypothetical protein